MNNSIGDKLVYQKTGSCHICGSNSILQIIDFAETPLSDRLLSKKEDQSHEIKVPLTLGECQDCSLVQIMEIVKPSILFHPNYPYYSSVSPSLIEHFSKSASIIIDRFGLNRTSQVIEIASNDGYMLKNFVDRGIGVLGIEPTPGPCMIANDLGIKTLNEFFDLNLALQLKAQGMEADLILANNVLAHVSDIKSFVSGIKLLLKPSGNAVIEVPYLFDLIDKTAFDTIYHQHICYFSIRSLTSLFSHYELYINRIEKLDIHGGSLRLFISNNSRTFDNVTKDLIERELNFDQKILLKEFSRHIEKLKVSLLNHLKSIKSEGHSIVGYGAAAKANTLMSYFEIDSNHLDYIVDLSPHKQGKYMSGNALEILSPEHLDKNPPDYILILAWNFKDEIIEQLKHLRRSGVQFIIPIPFIDIV